MCDRHTTRLAHRAQNASEKAVLKALESDLAVAVGSDGYRVRNRDKGTSYRVDTDGVVPVSCGCPADRYVYDGPCKHQVAVLSRLLNDAAALLTAIQRLTDGPDALTVSVPGVDYDGSTLTAVAVSDRAAKSVRAQGRPLPEYWADVHGRTVSPDAPVVAVRFDGGGKQYDFPADVLSPA